MWSAISSYLGESAAPAAPTPPRRSPPTTPRKLSAVMTSTAEKPSHNISSINAAQSNTKEEVTILRGIIVGTMESGKTSLLRRLRGEDISRTIEQRKLMALLPWKIPNGIDSVGGVTEEVVQFYLSEAASFSDFDSDEPSKKRTILNQEWKEMIHHATRKHSRKAVDFIVWMVDTRQDVGDVVKFVKIGLECLLPPMQDEKNENGDSNPAAAVQSLCILLNFRDLQKDNQSVLQQIRDAVDDVLTRHKNSAQPSVLVYEASMMTKYGIEALQSFITLPYLLYKEKEYERLIREVRKSYTVVKEGLLTNEDTSYDEFVHVASTPKRQPSTPRRQHSTSSKQESIQRSDIVEPPPSTNKQIIDESVPHGRPRQLFPMQHASKPAVATWTPLDTHQNLDSFFSDDESDDEKEADVSTQQRSSKKENRTNVVLDSDDESSSDESNGDAENSDDEFYIVNSGERHVHTTEAKSLKLKEECSVSEGTEPESEEKKEDEEIATDAASEDETQQQPKDLDESSASDTHAKLDIELLDENAPSHSNHNIESQVTVSSDDGRPDEVSESLSEPTPKPETEALDRDATVEEDKTVAGSEPVEVDSTEDLDAAKLEEQSCDADDANGDADIAQDSNELKSNNVTVQEESTEVLVESENKLSAPSNMVLDSDDESIDTVQNTAESTPSDTYHNDNEVQEEARDTGTIAKPIEKETVSEVKSAPTVSNAALAAIEAARLEAEQAFGNINTKSKEKKSKKEKKKSKSKDSKSKKSKRKESKAT